MERAFRVSGRANFREDTHGARDRPIDGIQFAGANRGAGIRAANLTTLIADQSPSNPSKSYWLNFLHTPTAFIQGPEKGARLGNIPVTYIALSKKRRGYYHMEAKMLRNNPGTLQEGELTKVYAELLEKNIRENPSGYLWSHKRWKHPWKEEYKKLWVDTTIKTN